MKQCRGNLIVIEGSCDGIGKTTQLELLKQHLKNDNVELITHHFPSYHTIQGRLVEEYLKGNYGSIENLSPYFINSLYAIDRAISWNQLLNNEYEKGKTILLDRYTTSSLIYQSSLIDDIEDRKSFIDYIIDFEYNKLQIKRPNHVIFLYAPFEVIRSMREKRKDNDGISNDIHERNIDYMKKVYENAMFVADYLKWDMIACHQKNEMKSKEDVHNEIYQLVRKRCNK